MLLNYQRPDLKFLNLLSFLTLDVFTRSSSILSYITGCGFPPDQRPSSFAFFEAGCFSWRSCIVLSSNGRFPLDILFVSSFNAPFTLPFSIIVTKLFDSLAIPFGLLMWFRRLYIAVASKISSAMSPLFHESRRRWSALMWSFDFHVLLGF